jgi:hypothetical protein
MTTDGDNISIHSTEEMEKYESLCQREFGHTRVSCIRCELAWELRANIIKMLGEFKESQDGGFEGYGEKHNWTHKSCLWELLYAKALILPHNIDLMHQEHNIAESIISMCFDVTGFSKDNVNARKDLADLCNYPSMEPKVNAMATLKRTWTPYCLKPVERKEILRWLKKLMFPDRYVSNIKRVVNISTGKLNGLKSHNYHIIIERLMPVMFRGYFDADLWEIFIELNYFYWQICAKQVSKLMMQKLEREIMVLICKMKKVFPLGWFNAMQRLLVLRLVGESIGIWLLWYQRIPFLDDEVRRELSTCCHYK